MKGKTLPKPIIRGFFILGVSSAICIRLIAIFNRFDPSISRILWYIGIIGYIFFFGYRFYIARKRRDVILNNSLIEKFESNNLEKEDKENINYILSSIVKSKEIFNYIFIFVLSIIAIIVDITLEILL